MAPGSAGVRGHKQLHQARAARRQAIYHTDDLQRDARSGRQRVHVPGLQSADVQEYTQRDHARRLP